MGFHSTQDRDLQSAYADWARTLDASALVAICLDTPRHAMAAFIGVNAAGVRCGICAKAPNDAFTVLDQNCAPMPPKFLNAATPFLTFTGGTTGAPKIIQRTPASWIHSFTRQSIQPTDRVAIIGSLTHSLALYAATEALMIGATPIYQTATKSLADANATVVYATPTQIDLQCQRTQPAPKVRLVYIGGGRLQTGLRQRLSQHFPNAQIHVFYGSAETSFATVADTTTPTGSVGKAYDGVMLTIKDGHIYVSGPMLFDGYVDTRGALQSRTDAMISVGELGYLDPDGTLYITGRADRQVNCADKTVQLDAVEDYILAIHAVTKAAVIALPDPLRGQALYAAIQTKDGTQLPLDLPPQIRPKDIKILDHWPTLGSGKTDYPFIADLFRKAL